MQTKYIFQGIGALVLLSAAWHYVGASVLQWLNPPPVVVKAPVRFQNDGPEPAVAALIPDAGPKNVPMPVSGARKCRKGSTVVYTDRDCPAGAQEVTIAGGAVTVVKGSDVLGKTADATSKKLPTARDVLVPDAGQGPNLREQQMERVINR